MCWPSNLLLPSTRCPTHVDSHSQLNNSPPESNSAEIISFTQFAIFSVAGQRVKE